MFKKSYKTTANSIFKKGLSSASNVSKTLGRASTNINDTVKKSNQLIQGIEKIPFLKDAIKMNPETDQAFKQTKKALKVAEGISNILTKTSDTVNPLSYRSITTRTGGINAGTVQKNINVGLQRAKDITHDTKALYNFVK